MRLDTKYILPLALLTAMIVALILYQQKSRQAAPGGSLTLSLGSPGETVPSAHLALNLSPPAVHHGWILAPHKSVASNSTGEELWDDPVDLCNAAKIIAENIVAQRMVAASLGAEKMAYLLSHGYQFPEPEIPGRHNLPAGTWVDIVGHESHTCTERSTRFDFIHVRIRKGNSPLNGRVLYIQDGNLRHD
jgi:hypothetical protein